MLAAPSNVFYKLFLLVTIATLFSFYVLTSREYNDLASPQPQRVTAVTSNVKYVLLWTPQFCENCAPFNAFANGRYAFKRIGCSQQNCFITSNRTLLRDITKFDAILFNGRSIMSLKKNNLPQRRHPKQIYVFVQLESADRFPICDEIYDGFFNKTFTYKLKSDYPWPYFNVASKNGTIIGPGENIGWLEVNQMNSVDEGLKKELRKKKKMAAWFVSNCKSRNNREQFVKDLQTELQRYKHKVDIYGKCGPLKCPKKSGLCDRYLEQDYYFYLSLENSFSEDYVTEKLLTPLHHLVVPVVYGAADYSRFLPPGSYLHGRKLGPAKLAEEMVKIVNNTSLYEDMFRWRHHYKFVPTWPPPLCRLCEELNNRASDVNVYSEFRKWWFPNHKSRC